MTRITWRRAHPVRRPERPQAFVSVHAELGRAYLIELERRTSEEHELAEELERKLSDEDAL
ncbi:MAG: hypothetical protein E5Y67_12540 [Mesorhizobium sp.]|uniref:hypothetical protein n=1 Tax=Mesorhizobium sp. TaxID=1871066 RepID=UPI0012009D9E|nr:hypothetical protein [Mesorhizobium sp.]TIM14500.1 MAG: hypothetical protein E5Y67_12540 [Mesorhizobium sp.]